MTHHAIEDLAIMRSLPNMSVVAPGDPIEARSVIIESAGYPGPLYIRLCGNNDPIVHKNSSPIAIGKGVVVDSGADCTIFSTGTMLACAKELVKILRDNGIYSTLISLHTIKPLDSDIILEYASKSTAVFTIEEHTLIGGLGSAVAEVLLEAGYKGIFRRVGLPDQYGGIIGRASYLRQAYGLTPEAISSRIMSEVKT
jgi:transketolase